LSKLRGASDQQLESDILGLLGFEHIEFVGFLLQHRKQIVEDCKNATARTTARASAGSSSTGPSGGGGGPKPALVGVSVRHEKDTKLAKESRREERRFARQSEKVAGADEPKMDEKKNDDLIDYWRSMVSVEDSALGGAFGTTSLPEGTTRVNKPGYEEVMVPPVIPEPIVKEDLIPISTFEDWAQVAFHGTKRLNRIQTKVYPIAYKTNHNMVSAPLP